MATNSTPNKKPETPPMPFEMGHQGLHISTMQKTMQDMGHYGGAVDGSWGPKTQKSVAGFQKFMGLPETGKYDTQTHQAVSELQAHPMGNLLADPIIHHQMQKDPRFGRTMAKIAQNGGAPAILLGATKKLHENRHRSMQ